MIKLHYKNSGEFIGDITEDQLKFIVSEMIEEYPADRDYYINRDELISLKEDGADKELMKLLEEAMGDKNDMDIVWSRA